MSNSVSHSSYNSANEVRSKSKYLEHQIIVLQELEFDLYDYEHKRMICETSDTGDSLCENFTISEFAPKKLFDSTDTVINIGDEILDEDKHPINQNTFGTPVVLRRGNYSSRLEALFKFNK